MQYTIEQTRIHLQRTNLMMKELQKHMVMLLEGMPSYGKECSCDFCDLLDIPTEEQGLVKYHCANCGGYLSNLDLE